MKKRIVIISVVIVLLMLVIVNLKNNDKTFKRDGVIFALTLEDNSGNKTDLSDFPSKGDYKVEVSCSKAKGKWIYDEWKLSLKNIQDNAKCRINFKTISSKDYLREKVEGLATTTSGQTDWQVVHETFVNSSSETIDTGYRYEGKNPNNYIWFNNELWRIIGSVPVLQSNGSTITNLVKIIRNNSIGGLDWNKGQTNEWANTSGNAVASLNLLLNGAYLDWETNKGSVSNYCYGYASIVPTTCDYSETGIKDEYRGIIKEVTWQLGGISTYSEPSSTFYEEERGTTTYNNSRGTRYVGKIGLMYPSDYGYSALASGCGRDTNLGSYRTVGCGGSAWLYGKGDEWTLSPSLSNSTHVFLLNNSSFLNNYFAYLGYNVRPVLYLDSSVYVVDGTGTINDPYIINM